MTVRLFVALYPPAEAVADLTARLDRLRIAQAAATGVNVRPANRDNLHVTLTFIGEVDDGRLPEALAALGGAASAWRRPQAAAQPLPRLRLARGGRFGRGRFTVLWVGVEGDLAALDQVVRSVRRHLRRARLPFDNRPYRPHLTVARPGDRVAAELINEDRDTLDGYAGPWWPATEMVLMRSQLGPRPQYDRVGAWSL